MGHIKWDIRGYKSNGDNIRDLFASVSCALRQRIVLHRFEQSIMCDGDGGDGDSGDGDSGDGDSGDGDGDSCLLYTSDAADE